MAILQLSLHNPYWIQFRPLWPRRDYAGAENSKTEALHLERIKCFQSTLRHRNRPENATISGHFGFVFEEIRKGKSRDYRYVIVFKKLRFQNVFCPRENEKLGLSNSSG